MKLSGGARRMNLIIEYDNENGNRIKKEYENVWNFIDDMESDKVDIPMMDYGNVEGDFFGNPLNHKHFDTIEELYNHCKAILE